MAVTVPDHLQRMKMLNDFLDRRAARIAAASKKRKRRAPVSRAGRRNISRAQKRRQAAAAVASGDASKLRLARIEAGLSQAQLARRAGISLSTVKRAERSTDGAHVHRLTWARLARALRVEARDIQPVEDRT